MLGADTRFYVWTGDRPLPRGDEEARYDLWRAPPVPRGPVRYAGTINGQFLPAGQFSARYHFALGISGVIAGFPERLNVVTVTLARDWYLTFIDAGGSITRLSADAEQDLAAVLAGPNGRLAASVALSDVPFGGDSYIGRVPAGVLGRLAADSSGWRVALVNKNVPGVDVRTGTWRVPLPPNEGSAAWTAEAIYRRWLALTGRLLTATVPAGTDPARDPDGPGQDGWVTVVLDRPPYLSWAGRAGPDTPCGDAYVPSSGSGERRISIRLDPAGRVRSGCDPEGTLTYLFGHAFGLHHVTSVDTGYGDGMGPFAMDRNRARRGSSYLPIEWRHAREAWRRGPGCRRDGAGCN